MSLKSMLKGKAQKDIEFQKIIKSIIDPRPTFTTVSGKKPFSEEYEELVPYSLSKPYNSTLVGTGFDYLARFIIAKNLKDLDVKKHAYNNLVAEYGLKKLGKIIDKNLYNTVKRKYEKGIKECEQFINNKKVDYDELLNFSGYLASLETVARSGIPPLDIKKSLIDDTETEIINDLRMLCDVFSNRFIDAGILKANSCVIFNPNFGFASMLCGGADADIFIDGTLYDFKCTKSKEYKWIECAQIVGYYLLHIIDKKCGGYGIGFDEIGDANSIINLAFYRGRFGEIENLDVKLLDEEKVEHAIEALRKIGI